ncbi:MAG: hypothetical protein P4L84_33135 [Isosphaeraceae bacterium]|nr:hypothetical protein [Isosphaeraceae bacterium]
MKAAIITAGMRGMTGTVSEAGRTIAADTRPHTSGTTDTTADLAGTTVMSRTPTSVASMAGITVMSRMPTPVASMAGITVMSRMPTPVASMAGTMATSRMLTPVVSMAGTMATGRMLTPVASTAGTTAPRGAIPGTRVNGGTGAVDITRVIRITVGIAGQARALDTMAPHTTRAPGTSVLGRLFARKHRGTAVTTDDAHRGARSPSAVPSASRRPVATAEGRAQSKSAAVLAPKPTASAPSPNPVTAARRVRRPTASAPSLSPVTRARAGPARGAARVTPKTATEEAGWRGHDNDAANAVRNVSPEPTSSRFQRGRARNA